MNFLNRFPLSLWTIACIALGFFGGTTINVTIVPPPISSPYVAPPGAVNGYDGIYQLDPQWILPAEPRRQTPGDARQVGEPFILTVPPADLDGGGKPIILTIPIEHLVGS